MTPAPLACALVDALQPAGLVLEPCAGAGAFVHALRVRGAEVATCDTEDDEFSW